MAIGAVARWPRLARPLAWRSRLRLAWPSLARSLGPWLGLGRLGLGWVGGPGSMSAPAMVDAGLRVMTGCLAAAGGGKAVRRAYRAPASLALSRVRRNSPQDAPCARSPRSPRA